jgi:hypothetical protein
MIYIYIPFLLVLVFFSQYINDYNKIHKIIISYVIFLLSLFLSFRGDVDPDYKEYYGIYYNSILDDASFIDSLLNQGYGEPLFKLFNIICNYLQMPFQIFLFLNYIVILLLIFNFFQNNTKHFISPFVFFVLVSFCEPLMITIRWMLALSLILIGFDYYIKKKISYSILILFVASFIHTFAIFFILIILLNYFLLTSISLLKFLIISLLTTIVYFYGESFAIFILSNYDYLFIKINNISSYVNQPVSLLFLIKSFLITSFPIILYAYYNNKFSHEPFFSILITLFIAELFFINNKLIFYRIDQVLTIFSILLTARTLDSIPKYNKFIINFSFLLFFSILFFYDLHARFSSNSLTYYKYS